MADRLPADLPRASTDPEVLREALLDLEQLRTKEREAREDAEGLLRCLKVTVCTDQWQEMLQSLVAEFAKSLRADMGVLFQDSIDGFRVMACTGPHLGGERETPTELLGISVGLSSLGLSEPGVIRSLFCVPDSVREQPALARIVGPCRSLLGLTLQLSEGERFTMLCGSESAAFFTRRQKRLTKHLLPVVKEALDKTRRLQLLKAVNERLHTEIEERTRIEEELRLAQKLEAVGQLASGIAHEINTPMQFIGDNVEFLQEAFECVLEALDTWSQLGAVNDAEKVVSAVRETVAAVEELDEELDLEFIRERAPKAIESAQRGIRRVSEIVTAMRAFSHPQRERSAIDLNEALRNTITVAHSETKYVAEVRTEFGDIPLVECLGGDINQVFLNLIVNAAHAIGEKVETQGGQGAITIRTSSEEDWVTIAVEDTGGGIPHRVRHRIFDPFFTTKGVGKGTGQGLSLAHRVVVDHHQGELTFDTELGVGTTFTVRLPRVQRSDAD